MYEEGIFARDSSGERSSNGPRGNLDLLECVLCIAHFIGGWYSRYLQLGIDSFQLRLWFVLLSFHWVVDDRRLDFGFST